MALLDHLVGAGKEGLRHGEAERLLGLELYDQLECGAEARRRMVRVDRDSSLARDSACLYGVAGLKAWRVC
jgi:hypothetical protein